jgi:hypothetical protein
VTLAPAALKVHAEARVDPTVLRAAPALAHGVLYVKTSARRGGGAELLALEVGQR